MYDDFVWIIKYNILTMSGVPSPLMATNGLWTPDIVRMLYYVLIVTPVLFFLVFFFFIAWKYEFEYG